MLVNTKPNAEFVDGVIDLDFRTPTDWRDTFGGKGVIVLFGDDECGPFAFFSALPPRDEMMPLSFSHAHGSDNWRISVRGTQNMGPTAYEQGDFRFHDGGKPYPGDNVAWGPDGGFGLVMFGDRRGFAIQPVKKELVAEIDANESFIAGRLGITRVEPCPTEQNISTTLGRTERSFLNGGFDSSPDWPELAPEVRFMTGLMGDLQQGPLVVLIDAGPGAEALPSRTLGTETILIPVSGSVHVGVAQLDQGCIRVEQPDTEHPAAIAGSEGVQLIALIGDRDALASAVEDGTFAHDVITAHAAELASHLTSV